MKKILINIALAAALLALVSCQSPFQPPQTKKQAGTGILKMSVNGQGSARTIMPVVTALDDYDAIIVVATPGGGDAKIFTFDDIDGIAISLAAGTYDIVVTAKKGDKDVAKGEKSAVEISADGEKEVDITLVPLTEGSGTFSWDITFPAAITDAEMTIDALKPEDGTEKGDAKIYRLKGTVNTGEEDYTATHTLDLAVGGYSVVFTLEGATGTAKWREILIIYPNLVSEYTNATEFTEALLSKAPDFQEFINAAITGTDDYTLADVVAGHFDALGIDGVTSGNLAAVKTAIGGFADDYADTDQELEDLKVLVDAALIEAFKFEQAFGGDEGKDEAEAAIAALAKNGTPATAVVCDNWSGSKGAVTVEVTVGGLYEITKEVFLNPFAARELFKGAKEGLNPDYTIGEIKSYATPWASWRHPDATVSYEDGAGHTGETVSLLKLNSADGGELAFAIKNTSTPFSLNGYVALSFWAKSNAGFDLVGFGDINGRIPDTNVWLINTQGNTQLASTNNVWKRFIIPIPNPEKGVTLTEDLFVVKTVNTANNGTNIFWFDDIEFITTGVTLQSINNTSTAVIELVTLHDAPITDFIRPVDITFVYSGPDAATANVRLISDYMNGGASLLWNKWFGADDIDYKITDDADPIAIHDNVIYSNGMITGMDWGDKFFVQLVFAGQESTPRKEVSVKAGETVKLIDNFTQAIANYWNVNTAAGYFSIETGGPNGLNRGAFYAAKNTNNTEAGRNFTAIDISEMDDITFWVLPSVAGSYCTFTFTLYTESSGTSKNGTEHSVVFATGTPPVYTGTGTTEDPYVLATAGVDGLGTGNAYHMNTTGNWRRFKIPISEFEFTDLEKTAVTGWSIEISNKTEEVVRFVGGAGAIDVSYADIRAEQEEE